MRAFARRCAFWFVLAFSAPAVGSCTGGFPDGDYWNLAVVYNLIATLRVTGTSPAENATDVKLTEDIAVLFNRSMDTSTITVQTSDGTCAGAIQLSADNFVTCLGGTIASSNNNATFVFNPTSIMTTSTTYKIKVTTAAKDSQGESLSTEYLQPNGFTTALQPAVSSITPATGTGSVAVNSTIQFTFNKAMEPASVVSVSSTGNCVGRSVLLSTDGFTTCLGGTITTSDNTTFTFTPTSVLTPGTGYAFAVANSVRDSSGNTPAAAASSVFTVYRPPVTAGAATMQLWLLAGTGVFSDAGATAANNGDQVQQWNDQSGMNNHALQGSLNQRARYVQGILNGQDTMRFDGTNDNFILTSINVSPTATPYTILILHRGSTLQQHALISQFNGAGTGRTILKNDNTCGANHRIGVEFGGVDTCSNTNLAVNTWYITTATSDMTNINFYNFGTADGGGTPTLENATGSWRIGSDNGGTSALDGDIAEIIFYNNVLTATHRQRIECYLANRYGLTITGHACN